MSEEESALHTSKVQVTMKPMRYTDKSAKPLTKRQVLDHLGDMLLDGKLFEFFRVVVNGKVLKE